MDKPVLSKMIDVILAPILPQPGEMSGGITGLLSGGGILQAMEAVKNIQGILSSGHVGDTIADTLSPEALESLESILLEAGYKKEA